MKKTQSLKLSRVVLMLAVSSLAACSVTPEPFDKRSLVRFADELRNTVVSDQEALNGPIDLYQAMARALKYNLDKRVEMMTVALRQGDLRAEEWNMLPRLVASVGYDGRNNYNGSSSQSLVNPLLPRSDPSTSSEKSSITADLTASWDILDYGLSYARANQAADEVLIAQERKRKVVVRIIEDVRTAYWRAISSERLIKELVALEGSIKGALAKSRKTSNDQVSSPLKALNYQRELMQMQQESQRLHRELKLAKFQLAALMNLEPGIDFELAMPNRRNQAPKISVDRDVMMSRALQDRPELREVGYQKRINEHEARAAYLKMLPSVKGFVGINYDSNDFLYRNNWVGWGARASWNLLNVFSYGDSKAVVDAQDALLDARAKAMAMAVMTQVEVSVARFEHLRGELNTARKYHDTQRAILDKIRASHKAGRVSQQTFIRERMNTVVSDVKYDIANADLQNAYANLYASVGADPFSPDLKGDESVAKMAKALKTLWESRESAQ